MLDDRGVNVAMITDSPILSEESLYHHVGEAVREGLAQGESSKNGYDQSLQKCWA